MARGTVEVNNFFRPTQRADAVFEGVRGCLERGAYFWVLMGTKNEDKLGSMKKSDGDWIFALKVRNYPDVMAVVNENKIGGREGVVLIGEAQLLVPNDLARIRRELPLMGLGVKLYSE